MPTKRKITQTLRDIFENGCRVFSNSYQKVTNYWDLMGERKSERKRHRI